MSELQQQIPQDVEVAQAEKKKKLSLKKNVDQTDFGGPKRAISGFMLFGADKRAEGIQETVKADCEKKGEEFKIVMVLGRIGELWKAASEETKASYNAKSKEAAAKYHADMEAWKLTEEYKKFVQAQAAHTKKKDDKKAVLAAKDSGMPNRPMAGYMIFAGEVRDEVRKEMEAKGEKYAVGTAAPHIKAKWEALGEEGQKKFHDAYAVAKKKYEEDLAAWLQTEAGQAFTAAKGKAAQKRNSNQKVGPKAKRVKKASTATGDEATGEEAAGEEATGEEAAAAEHGEELELSSPAEEARQSATEEAAANAQEVAVN